MFSPSSPVASTVLPVADLAVTATAAPEPVLQTTNLTYTFDPTKEVGHRVLDVQVAGKPVDLKATYTIATSNFIADGGDDFTMLKAGSNIFNTGVSVTDLLQQYIQAHSPITPPALGRVTMVGK